MYQKGDMRKYQLKVKKLVKSGEISKEQAIFMILGRAQQWLLEKPISKEQFMLDRMGEAEYVN